MEKRSQITITESDDGFTIEVTGKTLKEALSWCCLPVAAVCKPTSAEC
jgi:hypothetical protein